MGFRRMQIGWRSAVRAKQGMMCYRFCFFLCRKNDASSGYEAAGALSLLYFGLHLGWGFPPGWAL